MLRQPISKALVPTSDPRCRPLNPSVEPAPDCVPARQAHGGEPRSDPQVRGQRHRNSKQREDRQLRRERDHIANDRIDRGFRK